VPVLILIGVGFYFRAFLAQRGPVITITLSSAEGIHEGQTPLVHRGVTIGVVSGVDLIDHDKKVAIEVRLKSNRENFAREGAIFWIVRPEISDAGFQGFGTVLSGPYLDCAPGKEDGEKKLRFEGLDFAPTPLNEGFRLVLHTPRLGHLADHSPVSYRGVEVGSVKDVQLNRDGSGVDIQIVVARRYSGLIRTHTKFWADGGIGVKGGIFSGVEMKLDSLHSLVSGGVAFATPDKDMGDPVKEGAEFILEDSSKSEWLAWKGKK
jgi:paraquat-inducible protein B